MNEAAKELVALYGKLQECSLKEQSLRKAAFDAAVVRFARANPTLHPDAIAALARRYWQAQNRQEQKRKGQGPASELLPGMSE